MANAVTDNQEVNALLAEVVRRFGNVLKQERFSVYLTGSFASGQGSWLSDVDVAVIWELDRTRPWELVHLNNVSRELVRISQERLDPMVLQSDQLSEPWTQTMLPELIKASVLLAGADVLRQQPLPEPQVQAEQLARRACTLIQRIHGIPANEGWVQYPDPSAPLYSYETKRVWYPKGIEQGPRR